MLDVLNLALPFFGLIFLGLVCGKLRLGIPETGLAWLGFFLIYLALPCLFYRVLALTPLGELSNPRFILGTTLATATAFAFAFGTGWIFRRNMAKATIAGLSAPTEISATWDPVSRWRHSARPRTCRSRSSFASTHCSCS